MSNICYLIFGSSKVNSFSNFLVKKGKIYGLNVLNNRCIGESGVDPANFKVSGTTDKVKGLDMIVSREGEDASAGGEGSRPGGGD